MDIIKNSLVFTVIFLIMIPRTHAQKPVQSAPSGNRSFAGKPFLWGASSAAYQVEGNWKADGKGLSKWDVWMNRDQVAGPGVNGNVAIDFYNRKQYMKDLQLFKQIGLKSYRFSVSWPRIMPDGIGKVNEPAIRHYRKFIEDMRSVGIEPVMTLYHWDMPYPLYLRGGWDNRESVDWFAAYSKTIFEHFGDLVKIYVLNNEIPIETGQDLKAETIARKQKFTGNVLLPAAADLERALIQYNHKLLAAAAGAKAFYDAKIPNGEVGIALPLWPTIAVDKSSNAAADFADGLLNRWFLDALYKGSYPKDILDYAHRHHLNLKIAKDDAALIHDAHFTFLGINYYAPVNIKADATSELYGFRMLQLPGEDNAANGPNRPDQFERLLLRLKEEYGNPTMLITENGANFSGDDEFNDGQVNDSRRSKYLIGHIAAMQSAQQKGCNVVGYHVWSSHDNLEWLSGYGIRYGIIYVDFKTQKRTLKTSAKAYAKFIQDQVKKVDQ